MAKYQLLIASCWQWEHPTTGEALKEGATSPQSLTYQKSAALDPSPDTPRRLDKCLSKSSKPARYSCNPNAIRIKCARSAAEVLPPILGSWQEVRRLSGFGPGVPYQHKPQGARQESQTASDGSALAQQASNKGCHTRDT